MHDLKHPFLAAEQADLPKQRIAAGQWRIVFLPTQPVFFFGPDHTVAQTLGFVARHHELHSGEERLDELLFLVVKGLANAFCHRHHGALQLQRTERNPVDVEHKVRSLGVFSDDRHLLGDSKIVSSRVFPVDQPNGDVLLSHARLNLHPIAEQSMDLAVGVIECLAATDRGRSAELVQGLVDDRVAVASVSQPVEQSLLLDVAVVGTVFPVAEVGIAENVAEILNHATLCAEFPLADQVHGGDSLMCGCFHLRSV